MEKNSKSAATRGSPAQSDCVNRAELICFISGELPADEELAVDVHLRQCGACRESLRQVRVVFQTCALAVEERADGTTPLDDATFRQVLEARAKARGGRWRGQGLRWLAAAALLLVVLVPVVMTLTRGGGGAETVVRQAVLRESTGPVTDEADEELRLRWIPEDGRETENPPREVSKMLAAHGFARRALLSARRTADWREQQVERRESVRRSGGLIYVTVSVTTGSLREVVLVVREDDSKVVGESWSFVSFGRLEVQRLGADVFARAVSTTTRSRGAPER